MTGSAAVSAPGHPRPVTPMGRITEQLATLIAELDDGGPPANLRTRLQAVWRLAAGLDEYVEANTTAESPALRALAHRTAAHDWRAHHGVDGVLPPEQEMLSGAVEGRLLGMLVHLTRTRRILEIGLFTGYSALAFAEALPPDGRVIACEIDPAVAGLARTLLDATPAGLKIDIRVGPAARTLEQLADDGDVFDLVFIDADKAGYATYLELILNQHLVAPGGLICVDNTLMQGRPWTETDMSGNTAAIAAFNRRVAADIHLEQVLLPLRDGLTLMRRVEPSPHDEE